VLLNFGFLAFGTTDYADKLTGGQGGDSYQLQKDDPPRLRKQALAWFQSELQRQQTVAERQILELYDSGLAHVREAKELAKLPTGERKEWEAFWAYVQASTKPTALPNLVTSATAKPRKTKTERDSFRTVGGAISPKAGNTKSRLWQETLEQLNLLRVASKESAVVGWARIKNWV
jgi:hypothetical protein